MYDHMGFCAVEYGKELILRTRMALLDMRLALFMQYSVCLNKALVHFPFQCSDDQSADQNKSHCKWF